ncbi:MAG TPA: hypothetical protein VIV65_11120 [Gemmatimonadaceae bacterium]|jgi:hypothetical protein
MMVLGFLRPEAIPDLASALLGQGIESRFLVLAAGHTAEDVSDPRALFEQALDELRPVRMSREEALRCYAGFISSAIVAGEITALAGAQKIWRAVIESGVRDVADLGPFIYAAAEMEARPTDREFFENAIRDAATRCASW